jgi:hypothetical protein
VRAKAPGEGRSKRLAAAASTFADAASGPVSAVASTIADAAAGSVSAVASTLADAAAGSVSAVASIVREVDDLATGARRRLAERPGARVRRVRRMGQQPLAILWERHPEARRASMRQLGVQTVPVERVAGSAVEGPAQRGGDFLPIKKLRGPDWQGRWRRIRLALDQLVDLPPVELTKFGDEYWVVDGHNRVAAALYNGQVEIDAFVTELLLPGMRASPAQMGSGYLEATRDLRAAGAGRFSPTAVRPTATDQTRADMEHHHEPHRSE